MRQTNYIYIHTDKSYENHNGVVCFGYRHTDDNNISVTAAFCSPKDKFSRKKAHLIIEGRFNVNRYTIIETDNNNIKYKDAVHLILNSFIMYPEMWEESLDKNIPEWCYTIIKNADY